jgi:hypothetical protein
VGLTKLHIGSDSTSINTGWSGGALHHVENMLEKKIMWIVCVLQTSSRTTHSSTWWQDNVCHCPTRDRTPWPNVLDIKPS